MMRQDQFLRYIAQLAAGNLPGLIQSDIAERLAQLKPVAYENEDLSCGFSGDGIHHICGDRASINRVRYALNCVSYVGRYREAQERYEAAEDRCQAIAAKVENIRAALDNGL